MASNGALAQPDITSIRDPDEVYRQLMQLVGRDLGLADWGSSVAHTSYTNNATYAHTDRNQGTPGGGLHYQALHSATGNPVVQITDAGLLLGAGTMVPFLVGAIVDYAGSSTPTGWLVCDGSSKLRSSFPALFTAIGTTWGAADGTHFNVPDLRGRVRLGASTSPSHTLGSTGGGENHGHTIDDHSHGINDHSHGPGTLSLGHRHAHTHGYAHNHTVTIGSSTATQITDNLKTISPEEADAAGKDHGHTITATSTSSPSSTDSDNNDVTSTTSSSGATADKTGMVTQDKTGMVAADQSHLPPFGVVRPLIFAGV